MVIISYNGSLLGVMISDREGYDDSGPYCKLVHKTMASRFGAHDAVILLELRDSCPPAFSIIRCWSQHRYGPTIQVADDDSKKW